MKLEERISAFAELGNRLRSLETNVRQSLYFTVASQNPWFTPASIDTAFNGISKFLDKAELTEWTRVDHADTNEPKDVGVIMAGNIPMVGFHDMLCVLLSGHRLLAKFSSQDAVLMKFVTEQLIKVEPGFAPMIEPVERLNDAGAVIATGSDNTARYFEYYFRKIPHIIRKNRSSCAILTGKETHAELESLGRDVFTYFGLGCRNVSKLFVPAGYDFAPLLESWSPYQDVINHHKYANNYDYNKAILLVNGTPHFDSGFVLLTPNTSLVSPISVVYYEEYKSADEVASKIEANRDKIQCVVSQSENGNVKFGASQFPKLNDYADGVNTMKFLATAL